MKESDPRPIVCGTDFSAQATEASNLAAAMAQRLGTRLVLVHGVDERGDISAADWPSIRESVAPQVREEAERLRALGAAVEEDVSDGIPEGGVAAAAERADARLIVVGASGQGMLGHWMLGSVSERIAESAWVPTLVLRRGDRMLQWAHGGGDLRVFVAADFTSQTDAALAWAAELREIGPCEYTVGYVDRFAAERADWALHAPLGTPLAPEMQQMLLHDLRDRVWAFLPRHETDVRVLPTSGHVETHLLEMATEACADLIVVGTHQWAGLSRMRHPSVSRRLLRAARTNVVCVPAAHVISAHTPCVASARRVIVATDLSPHGGAAIPYAFSMLQLGGQAWLFHVCRHDESRDLQLARLQELIPADIERQGYHVEPLVVEGDDVAETICDVARQFNADLICMGSHGPVKHPGLLESVSRSVVARSTCPVLVVPRNHHNQTCDNSL
jgi:nucleotide-binding universal stress UspA family protein